MGNFITWLESNIGFETVIVNSKFTDMTAMAVYADYLDEHTREHEAAILLRNPLNYVGLIVQEDGTRIETPLYNLPITIAELVLDHTSISVNNNIIRFSVKNANTVSNHKITIYYYQKKHNTEQGAWGSKVYKSGNKSMPELLTKLLVDSAKTYTKEDILNSYESN